MIHNSHGNSWNSWYLSNTFMLFGFLYFFITGLSSVEAYNMKANEWFRVAPMNTRRSSVGVGVVGGKVSSKYYMYSTFPGGIPPTSTLKSEFSLVLRRDIRLRSALCCLLCELLCLCVYILPLRHVRKLVFPAVASCCQLWN